MGIFLICLAIGLGAGTLSGILGIGGAIAIIPCLVYFLHFNQHLAQGTTLALMVPPIGLLAALVYYKAGFVDLKVASFICLGFAIGGLLGAKVAILIPTEVLKKIFGLCLLLASIRMMLGK
ncbi:MAG: sulfite exporter TauE/SafE family protein [Candidatus Saelkia tenebricola]|nr:sulfite exporter TauE/SafE family protein [Candidatus Saelkia tenebricola]